MSKFMLTNNLPGGGQYYKLISIETFSLSLFVYKKA